MDYLSESAKLGAAARKIINAGDLTLMKYDAVTIQDEDVKKMAAIFGSKHHDITVAMAVRDSRVLSEMQRSLFGDVPDKKEKISVYTSQSAQFSDLMVATARLSKVVSDHYFAGQAAAAGPRGGPLVVDPATRDMFYRQYKAARDDDERKMLLSNNRLRENGGIEEYQNWKTSFLVMKGEILPPGVVFKSGGNGNQIEPNTQLFTFPLMVAYLRSKYTEGQLSKMMMFFNATGDTRRKMTAWQPEEFALRVQNNNPLLIPLCGLTTAKIAGSISLAVGGPCFTLAGLAFVAPGQEIDTLNVMHELIGLCRKPIDANNAGFYQTIASTVYRYLEPRMHHMNESRIRGTEYLVNDEAVWYYDLNARTLRKKKPNGMKGKTGASVILASTQKKKRVNTSTSPDN